MRKPLVQILAFAIIVLGMLAARARADNKYDLARARLFISQQIEMIKNGNVEELQGHFTARLKDKITEAAVKKAQAGVAKSPIEDLVATIVRTGERVEIKRKDGRTLTTLIRDDGTLLAETVWFQ